MRESLRKYIRLRLVKTGKYNGARILRPEEEGRNTTEQTFSAIIDQYSLSVRGLLAISQPVLSPLLLAAKFLSA